MMDTPMKLVPCDCFCHTNDMDVGPRTCIHCTVVEGTPLGEVMAQALAALQAKVDELAPPPVEPSIKVLFDIAENAGAGKMVWSYFRDDEDEDPFKVVVVLHDEPKVVQKYLNALDAVEKLLAGKRP